jgi:hypothetical protein
MAPFRTTAGSRYAERIHPGDFRIERNPAVADAALLLLVTVNRRTRSG